MYCISLNGEYCVKQNKKEHFGTGQKPITVLYVLEMLLLQNIKKNFFRMRY